MSFIPEKVQEKNFLKTNPVEVDIILIGGGLVGGSFACAAAQKGLRVALVDQALPHGAFSPAPHSSDPHSPAPSFSDPSSSEDPRTTALSYGSFKILEDLGILKHLPGPPPQPIKHIRVSQHGSFQVLHFKSEDMEEKPLGFMLKNTHLRQGIARCIADHPLVDLYIPNTLQALEPGPQHMRVTLTSGQILKAPLVVGADGGNSPLRQQLGIQTIEKSYDQKALIFNIEHSESHKDTAFEHFLPSGVLALLPFPQNQSAVVWSDRTERVDQLMGLPADFLLEAFQTRFGYGLGKIRLISRLSAYPLKMVLPLKMTDHRLAFVGDAAHVIHPISAQGLNLGLRDVQCLARLVLERAYLGLDLGSASLTDSYEKQRHLDVLSMVGLTHSLIRIFGVDLPFLRYLRGGGLKMLNAFSPLKRALVAHSMGISPFLHNE